MPQGVSSPVAHLCPVPLPPTPSHPPIGAILMHTPEPPTAGSRPTMISTRDFSLASHIAAVNAGVRRAKGEAAVASSSLAPPPPPPAGNNLMMASVEKAVVASQAWELQQNMHEAVSLQVQKQATEEQPHECSAQEGEVQRRVGHKARWQVTGQAQEQTQKEMDWVRHVGDRDEEPLG